MGATRTLGQGRWWRAGTDLLGVVLGALLGTGGVAQAQAPERVPAALVTDAAAAHGVAIWVHPSDVARSAVLVAEGDAGLAVYALDGGLLRREAVGGTVTDVDVAHALPPALGASSLVLAVDAARQELVLLTVDPGTLALTPVPGSPLPADGGVRLGALQVSADRSEASVIAAEPMGTVRQWVLAREGQGAVSAAQVRDFRVPAGGFGLEALAVDDRAQQLYLVDRVQVHRVSSASDGGEQSVVVAAAGGISGLFAPSDVAAFNARDGGGYQLVSDSSRDAVIVFERGNFSSAVGAFHVLPPDGGTTALPVDRVAVQAFGLGGAFDAGLLVTAGAAGASAPVALTGWGEVAAEFAPPLRTDPLSDPRLATPDAGTAPDGGGGGAPVDRGPGGGGSLPGNPSTGAGCACSGSGGVGAVVGLAGLLLGLVRRRRG